MPTRTSAHLLGIDVGTGGTRAVLIDERGNVVAGRTSQHQPFASPHTGWAEQQPQDWWRATCEAVGGLIKESGADASSVQCVGFSGQMHGAVLLDEDGEVLRPALIWCDQRTAEQARELTEKIGGRQLIEWTCNPALTNFTLTKLMWVRKHEPRLFERFRMLQLPKDYVRFRLTGEYAMDVADASGTLLLDVAHRRWSHEMAKAADIDPTTLPKLFESQDVCGQVTHQAAALTGLKAGTPVVAGAGDQAAGAVGMGVVSPGAVHATIGTSGVVFASTSSPAMDPLGRLHTFCHAIPGRWHVMGVTQAAGLSLRWLRDNLSRDNLSRDNLSRDVLSREAAAQDLPGTAIRDPYDELTREAEAAPPGCDGVLWAPYLMGERTPHLDPEARAALLGLAANHGRGHIIRAVLEGVAYSLRDTLEILSGMNVPVAGIRLGGGGARSALWRQIQADVYRHAVQTIAAEEGAAYGAALLAGVGAKVFPSVDEACAATVKVTSTTEPSAAGAAELARQYERFRRVYPALKSIYP